MSNIDFNVTSWFGEDIEIDGINSYVIRMFGRMQNGESISVKVIDFQPFFYIKIPETWSEIDVGTVFKHLKSIGGRHKDNLLEYEICRRFDLHHYFCAGKDFRFMQLLFKTKEAFDEYAKIFNKNIKIPNVTRTYDHYDTYEKKVDPTISFIHMRKLDSAGWITLPEGKYFDNDDNVTTTHSKTIKCYYVKPVKDVRSLAPLLTLSYDIECISLDGTFPQPNRPADKIVSICGTVNVYGSERIVKTIVLGLDSSKRVKNADMQCFDNEKDLLLAWRDAINDIDPDFIISFNGFNFDNRYVYERSKQPGINCSNRISYISRLRDHKCNYKKLNISSAGLGDNEMFLHEIPGRGQMDIMKLVQQDEKLTEYSLNKVAEYVLKSKVTTEKNDSIGYNVFCDTSEVIEGNYVKFEIDTFMVEKKFQVLEVHDDHIVVNPTISLPERCKMCLAKDDMGPQELFDSFPKGPDERRKIHQYCVQDCALLNKISHRLDLLTQRMSLATVSSVPFDYIILRGQGIKALSLFAKICKRFNYLIRDLKPIKNDTGVKVGYEGATVLDPITGYYERPLTTLDFNSLYPNIERGYDMSHETFVKDEKYLTDPKCIENYHFRSLEYEIIEDKVATGKFVTRTFATLKTNVDEAGNQMDVYGIVGTILTELLEARKMAKKMKKTQPDKAQIYEGQQKALKVTANSIYGQLGSGVSPVGCIPIAAATTAGGRRLLKIAKDHTEDEFKPIIVKLYKLWKANKLSKVHEIFEKEMMYIKEESIEKRNAYIAEVRETLNELFENHTLYPVVAYGDTDSNFIDFKITHKDGSMPVDRWCRLMSMKLGEIESRLVKNRLPYPNNMAYEKVIQPCALMAKKNYLGKKYEDDVDEWDLLIMGFKLKRRDGSTVFQKVAGKAINQALNESVEIAIKTLKENLSEIIAGNFDIYDFVTTKLLRAKYKGKKLTTITKEDIQERNIQGQEGEKDEDGEWFWDDVQGGPAHVQLCQRMKERDPGSCPQMNTRIPYVYVVKENSKKLLQGERIEHPDYVIKKKLKIDYLFYITNQIMKPCVQFFELSTDEIQDIFDHVINEENKKNDEMFDDINRKKTMNIFSNYDFKFNDDIEDTDDEDDIYSKFLDDKTTKHKIDIFKKKEVVKTKKTKKTVKRTKTVLSDSVVANSIVRNIIHIEDDIFND